MKLLLICLITLFFGLQSPALALDTSSYNSDVGENEELNEQESSFGDNEELKEQESILRDNEGLEDSQGYNEEL
jgi:hypothetical protein